ncbi:hypothetical protein BC829DRAFT_436064 [Chytridium lagenaria]|nr:hypothetical protein BC829DRAFT_436064 [Chytridium lagenaria]
MNIIISLLIGCLHLVWLIVTPIQLGWSHLFTPPDLMVQTMLDAVLVVEALASLGAGGIRKDRSEGKRMYRISAAFKILISLPLQWISLFAPARNLRARKIMVNHCRRQGLTLDPVSAFLAFKSHLLSQPFARLLKTFTVLLLALHVETCFFWAIEASLPSTHRWIDGIAHDDQGRPVPFIMQYLWTFISIAIPFRANLKGSETANGAWPGGVIVEMMVAVQTAWLVAAIIHGLALMRDIRRWNYTPYKTPVTCQQLSAPLSLSQSEGSDKHEQPSTLAVEQSKVSRKQKLRQKYGQTEARNSFSTNKFLMIQINTTAQPKDLTPQPK